MKKIFIAEEFRNLLPELSAENYALLEDDILQNGCLEPLVLWNGMILIDGHSRYDICIKHGIPFKTINKEFGSRAEAIAWITTQPKFHGASS